MPLFMHQSNKGLTMVAINTSRCQHLISHDVLCAQMDPTEFVGNFKSQTVSFVEEMKQTKVHRQTFWPA